MISFPVGGLPPKKNTPTPVLGKSSNIEPIKTPPPKPQLPTAVESFLAPEKVPDLPSMSKMAKNVLSSLGSLSKGLASGNSLRVSSEEADRRMDICKKCTTYYREVDNRCAHCGCYLAVKTTLTSAHCPIHKW